MPISYEVCNNGHTIIAVADGTVTLDEFISYEIEHAFDERIIPPFDELFIVKYKALAEINFDEMRKIRTLRDKEAGKLKPHRCAIVVKYNDTHSWQLAKFYEGMAFLHHPDIVIVFGDERIARTWLGVE